MMDSRVALSFAFGLIVAAVTPTAATAQGIPLPTGSYLKTCRVVSFDQATGDLAVNCEGPAVGMFGHGTPDTSRMNVRGCKEGTIWNDQRQLYCLSPTAWGDDRIIPPGSYIDTCTDRKVVGGGLLVATCGAPNGGSVNASLDLRPCTWGKDITNNNGHLTCTGPLATALSGSILNSAAKSEPEVVKPVAVEPGLVKPVTIAPVAPAVEASPTDAKEGRKKKRKDRGERG
jgi:hypothetical protein